MSKESLTDEALRSAFQAYVEDARSEGGPDADRLWEAARGAASPEARRQVIDELARAPAAMIEWRLAQAVLEDEDRVVSARESAENEPAKPAPSAPLRAWWMDWRSQFGAGMAVVATSVAFVVVGSGRFIERTTPTDQPTYRQPTDAPIRSALDERQPLARDACVLRWTTDVDAVRFSISVTTSDLSPVSQADDLSEPSYRVPTGDLSKHPGAKRIMWRVTAERPDGTYVSSATFVTPLAD